MMAPAFAGRREMVAPAYTIHDHAVSMSDTFTLSAEGPNSAALIRLALSGFDADRLPVESLEIALGMTAPSKGVSFELTGDDIFDDASQHLSFYDEQAVDTLRVEINFAEGFDADQIPSVSPVVADDADGDQEDANTATVERVNDQRSDTVIPPDVPGRVSENTVGHLALWIAFRCLQESTRPLTINEISETSGMDRNRLGSQLSKLYREKGMFDRTRHSTESGGYEHYYSLDENVRSETERLGAPDPDKIPIELPESLHNPDSDEDESEESGW